LILEKLKEFIGRMQLLIKLVNVYIKKKAHPVTGHEGP
jgi:hypothetical protein